MKNLLYIGNNLNTAKANISSIQVLGGLLESEGMIYAMLLRKEIKCFDYWICYGVAFGILNGQMQYL